jgi:rfaE bifunctional protein kinase chain/domain
MTPSAETIGRLRDIVAAFPRTTVTVLGDLVADEFLFGEIARVSREAPVLILKHRERSVIPGGGANAINNLADLGVRVLPVGLVGHDEPGRLLLNEFRRKKISLTGILQDKHFSTVTKTRILAGTTHSPRQQVVRVDREPTNEPAQRLLNQLIRRARQYLKTSHALLVSDYGYGAATPSVLAAVRAANKHVIPITLDSRFRMLQFSGVTAATPNEPEVEEALGCRIGNDWRKVVSAGDRLMRRMKLQSLVITRGRDGMVAFERGQRPVDIPIFGSDEVADVTGAGDTVIATFTVALAAGASTQEAAQLANYAGGIVVMKRGTATVTRNELLQAIMKAAPSVRKH